MSILKSNTGVVIGTIISLILVLWFLFYSSSSSYPLLPDYNVNSILFYFFSMCFPVILGGAITGFIIEKALIKRYISHRQFFANHKKESVTGCIVGGIVFYPISVFLGIIGGGPLGAIIGSGIGDKINIGNIGYTIGIGVGIVIVIILVTSIGSIVGMFMGLVIDSSIRMMMRLRGK